MRAVHQRPFAPEDRSQAGHWEGDLIVGRAQGSVIGTLVERRTRMIRLLHLPSRVADTLNAASPVVKVNSSIVLRAGNPAARIRVSDPDASRLDTSAKRTAAR